MSSPLIQGSCTCKPVIFFSSPPRRQEVPKTESLSTALQDQIQLYWVTHRFVRLRALSHVVPVGFERHSSRTAAHIPSAIPLRMPAPKALAAALPLCEEEPFAVASATALLQSLYARSGTESAHIGPKDEKSASHIAVTNPSTPATMGRKRMKFEGSDVSCPSGLAPGWGSFFCF
jgi:hypothetical protein